MFTPIPPLIFIQLRNKTIQGYDNKYTQIIQK